MEPTRRERYGGEEERPKRRGSAIAESPPTCHKCRKPMTLETWFTGVEVRRFWFCTGCKSRVPAKG